MLGLGREEIAELLPAIEDFAEIGSYFDEPLRTYSSGMAMRLAFSLATARRPEVLIVDEAQNMDIETLEELRLLSNVNVGEQLLIQLILVGQPELGQTLSRPELSQFAQRISVDHHNQALDFPETRTYIEHRLGVAGATGEVFDRYACATVYYYSRGIPRAINNICDMALVYGYAEEVRPVSCDIVMEVIRTKPIIRELAGRRPRAEEDERLREMVLEIKGIDIAQV